MQIRKGKVKDTKRVKGGEVKNKGGIILSPHGVAQKGRVSFSALNDIQPITNLCHSSK